jgi:hypothetical protein
MALIKRRPLRDRLAERLVADAVAKGADKKKAEEVVADLQSERPILDWFLNGGWEKLVELVLKLIDLAA